MKYIITENQQNSLKKSMSELLNYKFKNSKVVCNIIVHDVDMEDNDYEYEKGLRYDIYVYLNNSFVGTGNNSFVGTGGIYGFRISTEKQIKRLLSNWFGLNDNEYYISIFTKDC
jgi:hypothetical protein